MPYTECPEGQGFPSSADRQHTAGREKNRGKTGLVFRDGIAESRRFQDTFFSG